MKAESGIFREHLVFINNWMNDYPPIRLKTED